jgi:hypothetical protein
MSTMSQQTGPRDSGPAFPESLRYQDVLPEVLRQEHRQERLLGRVRPAGAMLLKLAADQRGPRSRFMASSSGLSRNPT